MKSQSNYTAEPRICPVCGKVYNDFPALSRKDNKTYICPECGQKEALVHFFGSTDEEKQRITELVLTLNKASDAYYNTGTELMSNFEFDSLMAELETLEEKTGYILPDSPTQRVGAEVYVPSDSSSDDRRLQKVRHKYPALSLDKTKDVDLLVSKFIKAEKLSSAYTDGRGSGETVMWKGDGSTVVAVYGFDKKTGCSRLVQLATRGNGEVGLDITHNARNIAGLPLSVNYPGSLIVRGEVVMTYEEFARVNNSLPENERYSNPRNLANAAVSMLDADEAAERKLQFLAFDLVEHSFTPETPERYPYPYGSGAPGQFLDAFDEQLLWLKELGFSVIPFETTNSNSLPDVIRRWTENSKTCPFPVDGLVLALNMRTAYALKQPGTGHNPHYSVGMALKWADELYLGKIKQIEFSPSRTGLLNPVAVFEEPVDIEGVKVSRCTLHNISYVLGKNLKPGDRVEIYRANMVIPAIADNLDKERVTIPGDSGWDGKSVTETDIMRNGLITACPVCGQPVSYEHGSGSESDTIVCRCKNPHCQAKIKGRLLHFVERDCINIEGLAESTLQLMIDKGWVRCPADLYGLERNYAVVEELKSLPGFGELSVSNLLYSINRSRTTSFVPFVHSLGIENVGKGQAKLLKSWLEDNVPEGDALFPAFFEFARRKQDWTVIPGLGPVISESINNWAEKYLTEDGMFMRNDSDLYKLLQEVVFDEEPRVKSTAADNPIAGKTFVVTGKINHFPNRDALHARIESLGGKTAGSVSRNVSFLISNEDSGSSKSKKAKELGVPVITEDEFLAMAGISGE